ncbi:asparagine synthase (glutamine-hydrolyzing) [Algoriphagus sp. NG3]|uniref:asparagine synthase (glutamine-hydrolyzing) n=1 Tax=Algoriphagus sp. NG3 TaxID=3097546 RepID=UPI002A8042CE|nr:asparagine synthase (glutamine-hydrolyzing) [Algoriphagus sp. NG3]WPR77805.1 asparagine synthase (glutamine-hydrolyzing) [Algoriphagus sp. NG3]
MCGIVGFWERNKLSDLAKLKKMNDAIYHRGPDSEGLYVNGQVALGHRRLSILDLSSHGHQPFYSPCGNYILVFNGEIFNFKEFYPELKSKGYVFESSSDTEVLLYLLMEYGLKVLDRLNGFFAFALWQEKEQSLTLARDRFGVKPLFYTLGSGGFAFSSEPKGLFAGGYPKQIDEAQLDELLIYRYISGENTIFKNIKRLLPGHYMTIKNGTDLIKIRRWFHLGESALAHPRIANPLEWYEEVFYDSVKLRMISDVPVGTMLSGGLDSSSIAYAQAKLGFSDLSSWNVKFPGYEHDESHIAKMLSEDLGLNYNGYEFSDEAQTDLVKKALYINDEPLMHYTDNVLLGLSLEAKKKVTVLLTGEGADEVLGGYVRYKPHDGSLRHSILSLIQFVPDKYLKNARLLKLKRYLSLNNHDLQMMMNANELYLQDLKNMGILSANILPQYRVDVLEEAKKIYPTNRYRQLLYMEQHTHLQSLNDKNDRTSMGASIECREPYLDYRLVSGVASLPDGYFSSKGKGKLLSMKTVGAHLPEYIRNHRKIGMSMPWGKYILENDQFRKHLESMHESPIFKSGFLAHIEIHQVVKEFKANPGKNQGWMKQLFFLSLWYTTLFE